MATIITKPTPLFDACREAATKKGRAAIKRVLDEGISFHPFVSFVIGGPPDPDRDRIEHIRSEGTAALCTSLELLTERGWTVHGVKPDEPGGAATLGWRWLRLRLARIIWDPKNTRIGEYEDLTAEPPPPAVTSQEPAAGAQDQPSLRPATDRDIDECIIALDRARAPGSPKLNRETIRELALPWLEARGMTAKSETVEKRFQSEVHRSRRDTRGRRKRRS